MGVGSDRAKAQRAFRERFKSALEEGIPTPDSDSPPALPELFVALVRPQGTQDFEVRAAIESEFKQHNYHVSHVRLASLLREAYLQLESPSTTEYTEKQGYDRIKSLMAAGDIMRARVSRSFVAEIGVLEIARQRDEVHKAALNANSAGVVFLISSLVHPAEVSLLRSVYKQRFFLVGIHEPLESRKQALAKKFKSFGDKQPEAHANEIIDIDGGILPSGSSISDASLNINTTFHKADVFLLSERKPSTQGAQLDYIRHIERWLKQVFSYPHGTPTMDEYGMAHAFLAARQSVALGRSVGAAILDDEGEVVSTGWNEPARPGGGVSREDLHPDLREHLGDGEDSSDVHRLDAIAEFLAKVIDRESDDEFEALYSQRGVQVDWIRTFRRSTNDLDLPTVLDVRALAAVRSLASARMLNLIEFGRSVHAEMAAVTAAARRGTPTRGNTLYVTTYPCHECARNIVAAGIKRVVYVEPYGKSMSEDLYKNAISFSARETRANGKDGRIPFEQFRGIAPSIHDLLFSTVKRKHSLAAVAVDPSLGVGKTVKWEKTDSLLRPSIRGYLDLPNASQSGSDPLFEVARLYAESSVISQLLARSKATHPLKENNNVD